MNCNIDILPTDEERRVVADNRDMDVRSLALRLKASASLRPPYVLQQVAGRQAMKKKVPMWAQTDHLVYPVHLSVEQCSSEVTALYKAEIITSRCRAMGIGQESMVDLTGGFGVDFSFIGRHFSNATYVERNEELSAIVGHNLPLLGMPDAKVVNAECEAFLASSADHYSVIFIDPARRDKNGSKTVSIEDCTPNIVEMEQTLITRADMAVVKLSPMLDITEALQKLQSIVEIHVVSVDNECKELLLVLSRQKESEPRIMTYNHTSKGEQRFSLTIDQERNAVTHFASQPLAYLYEPNASVMKAGAFKSVAVAYGVEKLHVNSHLYTSTTLVSDFPGRTFRILSVGAMGKNTMPETLKGVEKANITVRNYPQKVDDIRKKLKMKDGGEDYIFATTIFGDKRVLIHGK